MPTPTEQQRERQREFPRGFGEHRRSQAGMGLRLSPAQRLRWLEETMSVLRRWRGRASAVSRAAGDHEAKGGGSE